MSQENPHENVSGEVAQLRRRVAEITEAFACSICHETLKAPVQLRCGHMFCSECVRRHLATAASCPHPHCKEGATTAMITPLRMLDAALEPVRKGIASSSSRRAPSKKELVYLIFLDKKGSGARTRITDRLRENHLPVTGNLDVLARRDKEFVIKWNANVDAAFPRTRQVIADAVMKEERYRMVEAKKHAARTKVPASNLLFFSVKSKSDTGANDSSMPVEGDDFDTLIRKVRERRVSQKRERSAEVPFFQDSPRTSKVARFMESVDEPSVRRKLDGKDYGSPTTRGVIPEVIDLDGNSIEVPPTPPSEPPSPPPICDGPSPKKDPEIRSPRETPKPEDDRCNAREEEFACSVGVQVAVGPNENSCKEEKSIVSRGETKYVANLSIQDLRKTTEIDERCQSASPSVKKRPRSQLTLGDSDKKDLGSGDVGTANEQNHGNASGGDVGLAQNEGVSRMGCEQGDLSTPMQATPSCVGHDVQTGELLTSFTTPPPRTDAGKSHVAQGQQKSPDVMSTQPQSPHAANTNNAMTPTSGRKPPSQAPGSTSNNATQTPLSPATIERIERKRQLARQRQLHFWENRRKSNITQSNL